MSKKTDQFGNKRHPGKCYRAYRSGGGDDWKGIQKEFKRKKRLRRISRLARKGKYTPVHMGPKA